MAYKKSNYKGVYWEERSGKWRAEIVINGKRTPLGRHKDEEVAAEAYATMAKKLGRKYGHKSQVRIDGDIAYISLTRGHEAIIDVKDLDAVKDYSWSWDPKVGAKGKLGTKYGIDTLLHRHILKMKRNSKVFHRNGNKLNCRRCNLQEVPYKIRPPVVPDVPLKDIRVIFFHGGKIRVTNDDYYVLKDVMKACNITTRPSPSLFEPYLSRRLLETEKKGTYRTTLVTGDGISQAYANTQNNKLLEFLESIGCVRVIKHIKQNEYLPIISAAFPDLGPEREYRVLDDYRIDLYLKNANIAIECDEHNHSSINPILDKYRERRIKKELKCKFIRFNPDEKNFNVGNVIKAVRSLL